MFDFNQFYRKFEDRYRGSTELIKDRLRFYLPFILPLKDVYPHNSAVDLGCGRGEWVELLADNGFFSAGVDTNDHMLGTVKREEVIFENKDALEYLITVPDESQSIVSAFHLIEHVSFEYLADMLIQAQRVLLPGGLLILETPNPENVRVATESFYLDPSHLRPIPMQFIAFLVDYVGLKKQLIVRLQEPADLQEGRISVGDLFVNVSPDYGIIAQKNAPNVILDKFSVPFGQSYGLSFSDLSREFNEQTQEELAKIGLVIEEKIHYVKLEMKERIEASSIETKERIETSSIKTEERIEASSSDMKDFIKQTLEQSLLKQIPEIIERYTEANAKILHHQATIESQLQQIQTLRNHADELENQKHNLELEIQNSIIDKQVLSDELISVYSSKSFRLTRPLRAFGRGLRKIGSRVFGINYLKGERPAVQVDSDDAIDGNLASEIENVSAALSDGKALDEEMTEDAKYFYILLKDLMRGEK